VLRQRWPYPPDQLTVVDGALDALDRVATGAVGLGDRVVVSNPTFPPLLDRRDRLRLRHDSPGLARLTGPVKLPSLSIMRSMPSTRSST